MQIEKYLPLCEDLKGTWQAKIVQTIPLIFEAPGEIPKGLKKHLTELELQENLQKTVNVKTSCIMRRVLIIIIMISVCRTNHTKSKATLLNHFFFPFFVVLPMKYI